MGLRLSNAKVPPQTEWVFLRRCGVPMAMMASTKANQFLERLEVAEGLLAGRTVEARAVSKARAHWARRCARPGRLAAWRAL